MVKRLLTRIIIEQANEILVFNLITNPPPLPPSNAILLLYVCPFVSMVAFGVMAYRYYAQHKTALTITFASLALLFQPFIKIALGRTMWNIVDVIVAILLVWLWIKERK